MGSRCVLDPLRPYTKLQKPQQLVGEIEDEGKGRQIRAILLSNRATALVKVRVRSTDGLITHTF